MYNFVNIDEYLLLEFHYDFSQNYYCYIYFNLLLLYLF
jgi:hypothetical protein